MRSFFDIVKAITFQHLVHLRKNTKWKTTFTTPEKAIKSAIDFSFFQWVCSFRRIQKRSFDLRFAGVRGRKVSDIRNWICNLGNLSHLQYAWQPLKKWRVFYLLANYAVLPRRILWSAHKNRSRKERVKVENYMKVAGSVWSSFVARIFYVLDCFWVLNSIEWLSCLRASLLKDSCSFFPFNLFVFLSNL